MSATPSRKALALARIAVRAGAVIMGHYGRVAAAEKADRSPVTIADQEAETLILAALATDFAGVPVVAEEAVAGGHVATVGKRFFLVDPLDGTREFLSGNGEFTVNIAEIVDGMPVAGVVYAPAKARLFVGDGEAFELAADFSARPLRVRSAPPEGLVAVGSRSHNDPETDAFLKTFKVASFVAAGSSLKFCLLAAGEADLYARHGRTMEWDTAAGHAVLAAAGGRLSDWEGSALRYGKPGFDNPPFVARGGGPY
jgi:3'(2'), 5'-bisphosphate nucleotidase